ncbi:MAG: SprB repeat-containing protein, partial [Candidatus Heimdallarchaeota archaeon]|nr:SprB repeat-containing protein [Candidatus Heimdallarchaeota archaeon]
MLPYLSPAQTDSTASSLDTGIYTVVVTDFNGCTQPLSVTVNEPALLVSTITASTNVSCKSGSDGQATVNVSGGAAPYNIMWSNGDSLTGIGAGSYSTSTGLCEGTITVTVTDSVGCVASDDTTISEPSQLLASITSSTDPGCNGGNDGSAGVVASGGTSPYTYSWSNGATSSSINGLSTGTYTVTVTEANGCDNTN